MPTTPDSRGVRVLVLDDYRPFADLLAGVLSNYGYEAWTAYSAKEVLHAIEAFTPHALVLDVLLPDGDGFEIAKECYQRLPACRVFLMSAWDFEVGPMHVPEGFEVVPKAEIMDRLLEYLDAGKP